MNSTEQKYQKFLNDIKSGKRLSPLKAIRFQCLDCCEYRPSDVQSCSSEKCVLHPFRFGRNTTGCRGQNKKMSEEDINRLNKSKFKSQKQKTDSDLPLEDKSK